MDMMAFKKKQKNRKMKYLAEQGHEGARELLNRSGFNRTPMEPAKPPVLSDGESLMRGHDVEKREDIPQSDKMYHMRADEMSSKPPEQAGLMKFQTQADQERANHQPEQPMKMKHGKRIFAKDPNYNPEPTTPAPNGPGTKQTNAAVGSPKKALASYPAGGPGGVSKGVAGPMMTKVQGHTPTGPDQSVMSHRNTEYAGEKAPNGPGTMQTGKATGMPVKSLEHYPGKKKRKMSHRGMAFVGRGGPGHFTEGSPA